MKKKRKPPAKRRARGTGTIFPDLRRGGFIARVPVGRLPNGRTRYAQVSGRTQAEVVERMKDLEPPGDDTTVREWAERWYRSLTVRDSSRGDYRHTLDRWILPRFGHCRVRDLTAHDIEAAAQAWAKPAGTLGPNTLRKNLGHFRACLEAARRAKLIPDNPVRDARKPKGKRPKIDPFSAAELAAVIDAATGRPLDAIFACLAATGIRIGEALALDVPDFDAAEHTLSISRTYSVKHGLRPPKSENGVRVVTVPEDAIAALALAVGQRKSGPLFATEDRGASRPQTGGRRQHNTVRAHWQVFLRDLDLRYRRPHQLRHSVATVWIAQGVGVGDVARHLGDSVQTVVTTYIHPSGVDPVSAMELALKSGRESGRKVDRTDVITTKSPGKRRRTA